MMKNKVNIGIVGASGYSGEELIKLINRHPVSDLKVITSRKYAGMPVADVFPRFGSLGYSFIEPDINILLSQDIDVWF